MAAARRSNRCGAAKRRRNVGSMSLAAVRRRRRSKVKGGGGHRRQACIGENGENILWLSRRMKKIMAAMPKYRKASPQSGLESMWRRLKAKAETLKMTKSGEITAEN